MHERVLEPLADRRLAPLQVDLALRAGAAEAVCDLDHPLRRVVATVEDHILDALEQLGVDVLVDRELAGVHDAHVQPGTDRVEQEHGVHRLAHEVVAAEREAEVRDAARGVYAGTALLDSRQALDERARVVVVLLDAGRDRKHVRVEDDVLRREPDLAYEQVVGAPADLDPPLDGRGLPFLVEGHHDDTRAVAPHQPGLAEEVRLTLLERDRVDDPLSLQALQPGLEHRPLRAVDHDRQARHLGLGRDDVQEGAHRLFTLEQVGVHVDVEQVRAAPHLLERDVDRTAEVTGLDEPPEAGRAGEVRAFSDQDETGVRPDLEGLEAAEARQRRAGRRPPRRSPADRVDDRLGVLGRRAAAGAGDVQQPVLGKLAQQRRRDLGRLVIAAEGIRKARVRMA